MERGEVQAIGDWSVSSLKTARPSWLPEKKINLLMQIALEKDPEFAHVPFALDFVKNDADRAVMQLYLTQKTVARPMLAPPGVPADRIAALRTAFAALATDQQFLADGAKAKLDVAPVTGPEVDKVIALITSASPETAAAPAEGDRVGAVRGDIRPLTAGDLPSVRARIHGSVSRICLTSAMSRCGTMVSRKACRICWYSLAQLSARAFGSQRNLVTKSSNPCGSLP